MYESVRSIGPFANAKMSFHMYQAQIVIWQPVTESQFGFANRYLEVACLAHPFKIPIHIGTYEYFATEMRSQNIHTLPPTESWR